MGKLGAKIVSLSLNWCIDQFEHVEFNGDNQLFLFETGNPLSGKIGSKKIKIVSFYFLFYFSTIFLQHENTQKVKLYIYIYTYIKIQVQYYSRCKEPVEGLECLFTGYL